MAGMHTHHPSSPASRRAARSSIVSFVVILLALPLVALALAPRPAGAHPALPEIPATNSYTPPLFTLHFDQATGGPQPFFVSADSGGYLYVSLLLQDQVYMEDVSGAYPMTVHTLGTGSGSGNGQFQTPGAVAASGNNVYVVDGGNHRIQVFDRTTGNYLSQFGGSTLVNPLGITLGSNGQLYVVDSNTFDTTVATIDRFDTSGDFLGSFGSYGTGNGQFVSPDGIASIPGYLFLADSGNNRVEEFDLAGNYVRQWGSTYLNTPNGISTDQANNVYVLSNKVIYIYDATGTPLGKYDGTYTSLPPAAGQFTEADDLTVTNVPGAASKVWVADSNQGLVSGFDLTTVPTSHNYQAQWGSGGSGNGQFAPAFGVAIDSGENVYVTDNGNNRVEKFDKYGNFLLQWGSLGSSNGQFHSPTGIAIDGNNNVFIADAVNNRIEEFTASGSFVRTFGSAGSGNGQLNTPEGVATDAYGNIYVADSGNDRVEVFSSSGAYQQQWGTTGTGNGQFSHPTGVAIDQNRAEVFVTDYLNNRVESFSTYGTFYAVINGSGGNALNQPFGIFVDNRGSLYVADAANNRVEQFDVNGNVVGSFGSLGSGNGQFNRPYAGAVDPKSGQMYVADLLNNRVERFGSPYPKHDTIGIWRPSTKTFYLRTNNSTGPANISVYVPYAQSTDLPVVGDWNGDGVDTVGLYRSSTGRFLLQDANVQETAPDYTFTLGKPGDTPIAGDWSGSGRDGVGVFRPSNGIIYLKNTLSTGVADYNMVLGVSSDKGVAGDWNGDGQDSPGIYRPSNQTFYLTDKVTNGVVYSNYVATLGISGDVPFTGDWPFQGSSGIGVFRPSNGVTYEKNAISTGPADNFFIYGTAGDIPVAGQWIAPGITLPAPPPRPAASKTPAPTTPAHSGTHAATPSATRDRRQ